MVISVSGSDIRPYRVLCWHHWDKFCDGSLCPDDILLPSYLAGDDPGDPPDGYHAYWAEFDERVFRHWEKGIKLRIHSQLVVRGRDGSP